VDVRVVAFDAGAQGLRMLERVPVGEGSGPMQIDRKHTALVVIDVSDKVAHNVDYAVSLDDVSDWETRHGRIPEGSLVALRTDWHTRWPDNDAMNNFDDEGAEHCPGWTIPVLRLIDQQGD